jgi:signal transduction histidine kinase
MILDLISGLTKQPNQEKTILKLVDIVKSFFAPNRIFYKSLENNQSMEIISYCQYDSSLSKLQSEDGSKFKLNYKLIEDPIGFIIDIKTEKEDIGMMEISDFEFPEYTPQYLTVARLLGRFGALAIENARFFEKIEKRTKELNKALEQEKLYKEVIKRTSQFKSEFMASMSHELRTPLNSIIGFTDVILERISGEINETQEKYLNNVKFSSLHLLDLINEILDIAKIETGKMVLYLEDVNLSKIISQINTMIKPIYKKKNLKFEVQEIDQEKIIRVDQLRFKEILFNLLSNAMKYTKEGSVKLKFSENEKYWKFDIIDTGIGIKEEDFNLLFQDFKRIRSDYGASIEGTGLGLSLTKKLIECHGGNISFTSIFGKGSTFTFTIPKNIK